MKKTNRLFSLFAAICVSATMLADVVYEPLIVDSGFNRDCIAEAMSASSHALSYLLKPGDTSNYFFATKYVIEEVNRDKVTQRDLDSTKKQGWPNDYREAIRCVEDAKRNPIYKDVFFQLAPYDQANVLTIRPGEPKLGDGKGTLKFKKVGCYSRVYFLLASARFGSKGTKTVDATIRYTDGSSSDATFSFGGLSGEVDHNFCKTNIYEGIFKKNTQDTSDKNPAYATIFHMDIEEGKLIHRIDFENKLAGTSVIIFAVTGVTADIDAPDEEVAQTSNIQENSFEACWDYIADAASYRLDVAEDIDFQHLVEGYNNLNVGNTTCQEVAGLLADNDYYWRVRSVNAQGGQSASSAPRRVKTAGGAVPATDEVHTDIAAELASWVGATVSTIKIDRILYRDGYYNTLCLPFSLTTEEIAASPLTGAQIYKFVHATKVSDAQLDIEVEDTTAIKAGVPYLIKWAPATPEIIDTPLVFTNVYIRTNEGQTIGGTDEVRFVGNIARAQMENGNHNNLFIGANNTLYWPNTDNKLRGFRAYFQVPLEGPAAVSPGAPARIVEHHQTTTEINIVVSPMSQNESVRKVLRDGQIYILRDGKVYSIMGQNVE